MFYNEGALKNLKSVIGKPLCWSFFFNKVAGCRSAALLKRDPCTGFSLWVLRNFQERVLFTGHHRETEITKIT